jgi:hypothetical protein
LESVRLIEMKFVSVLEIEMLFNPKLKCYQINSLTVFNSALNCRLLIECVNSKPRTSSDIPYYPLYYAVNIIKSLLPKGSILVCKGKEKTFILEQLFLFGHTPVVLIRNLEDYVTEIPNLQVHRHPGSRCKVLYEWIHRVPGVLKLLEMRETAV